MNYLRAMLNHHVFGTRAKDAVSLDVAKPLLIPAGADTLDAIGCPPGVRDVEFEGAGRSKRQKMWASAVEDKFGDISADVDGQGGESKDDNLYLEAMVSALPCGLAHN